jgi:hypothetical protein
MIVALKQVGVVVKECGQKKISKYLINNA